MQSTLFRVTSISFIFFLSSFLFANTAPGPLPVHMDEVYVFENLVLTISGQEEVIVDFDKRKGKLGFNTEEEMTFVQLLKENGELEYQIPTFSKSVILDLDDLSKGDYKLNLILESEKIIPASFSKK